jgi:hypothetical protein
MSWVPVAILSQSTVFVCCVSIENFPCGIAYRALGHWYCPESHGRAPECVWIVFNRNSTRRSTKFLIVDFTIYVRCVNGDTYSSPDEGALNLRCLLNRTSRANESARSGTILLVGRIHLDPHFRNIPREQDWSVAKDCLSMLPTSYLHNGNQGDLHCSNIN